VGLAAGTRLGPYEVLTPLGQGGMGEVYKARDTRLDRTVAIKILSTSMSSSSEARRRFEREARIISQLSHPHICALFDVGEAPDPESRLATAEPVQFLVMELVEGETLAERLARGALPLAQALRYGIEIADALDKAHRHGTTHRDLKPANVMVTGSGIKLLDFGLASGTAPLLRGATISAVDTAAVPAHLTQEGTIAGTLQYMSPEQLQGQPADARSDIFALGAVLYEMLTGRKAFDAGTPVAIAASILHDEPPPVTSIDAALPPALDPLVRISLAKDPERRWQTAHDIALQLAAIGEQSASRPAQLVTLPDRPRTMRRSWILAGAALLAGVVALLAAVWLRPRPSSSMASLPIRFSIPPPAGGAFSDSVETVGIALSPDGSQLAYLAADASGAQRVWLRPLSAVDARAVAGTEGARTVFWSPDSRSIAFFAGDKLKRLDVPDGAPVTITDVPDIRAVGTWGDGQILFSAVPAGIYRVSTDGGPPALEVAPDPSRNEAGVTFPSFLPDGRRYLYLVRHFDSTGSVMLAGSGQPAREILAVTSNAQYVEPGFLVFSREGTLVAQRFDADNARVVGEPFPIAEPVRYFVSTGVATFSTSRTGVLVYQAHLERGRLVWLDRSGREVGAIGEPTGYSRVRIAPDGQRIVFDRAHPRLGSYDLWMVTERGVEQRLTSDRVSEFGGVWLPDASALIFSARTPPHLFRKELTTGTEEDLLPAPAFQLAEDVSPDGRLLLFTQRTARGNFDIWTLPLSGDRRPSALLETPYDEASVRFSPDGRYIAFASDELGRYEVYVSPYPPTAAGIRVSTGGGWLPRWSRDGHELFYIAGDHRLVAVPVRTGPTLVVGDPQPLFAIKSATLWSDPKPNSGWPDFDVAPDGRRFLAIVPQPANEQPLTAVLNWLNQNR